MTYANCSSSGAFRDLEILLEQKQAGWSLDLVFYSSIVHNQTVLPQRTQIGEAIPASHLATLWKKTGQCGKGRRLTFQNICPFVCINISDGRTLADQSGRTFLLQCPVL